MRDEQGHKVKAKTMTRRQAIPYLEKVRDKVKGKKRKRAVDLAITGLEQLVGPREVSKTGS